MPSETGKVVSMLKKGFAVFCASAFAIVALADVMSASDFGDYAPGARFGAETESCWRSTATGDELEAYIAAYDEDEAPDSSTAGSRSPKDGNYLDIMTSSSANPLLRDIDIEETSVPVGQGGLYLDTFVQFTVGGPSVADVAAPHNVKIAVWVCGEDEDGSSAATTNFMVRAGRVNAKGSADAVSYRANDIGASFDYTGWHRLTIKAIENALVSETGVGISRFTGFVVYVDGVALATTEKIVEDGVKFSVSGEADSVFGTGSLFPCLVNDFDKLTSVGFVGTGKIDDLAFTNTAPDDFAKSPYTFTLAWVDGLSSVTVNGTPYSELSDGGTIVLTLAESDTSVTISDVVWADETAGFTLEVMAAESRVTAGDDAFSFTAGLNLMGSISKPVVDTFQIGDTSYGSLGAVLAAVNAGETIRMTGNYTVDGTENRINAAGTVTLDLNGHTLSFNGSAGFKISNGSTIKVINSADSEGKVSIGTSGWGAFVLNQGANVVVGSADDGAPVVIDGFIGYGINVVAGKILASCNTEGEHYFLAKGSKSTVEGDYVKVEAGEEEPEPTETTWDPSKGETFESDAENAEDAEKAALEALVVPDGATVEKTTYAKYFKYGTTGTQGAWVVTIVGIADDEVEYASRSALEVIDGKAGAKVTVHPGLYYRITTYEKLGEAPAFKGDSTLSDGTGAEVDRPGTTQGYIKIELDAKPIK